MAVTRIKNNQITDASNGNAQLGVNAAVKLQNYTVTSTKIANNLVYGSDLTVTGNLTVQGNTTTIDTTITTIEDPVILLASTQTSGSPTVDIGFIGPRGNQSNIAFVWDESSTEFVTAFTSTGETNTTISISSYANFHTNDANIGGNIVINGTTSLVGNLTSANVTGTVAAGNLTTAGVVSATGNVTGGNVNTAGLVTATGNVTGGNVLTGGLISATGSITSGANVSGANLLTGGLVSAGGNATAANFLTAGVVSATGNVTGNYFIGNGSQLTGVVASSVDANLLTGNTLSSNVLFSSLTTVGTLTSLSVTGNTTTGNLLTGGLVSATGNVTGSNLITGGLITATGNINTPANVNAQSGNINAQGGLFTGNITVLGNINGAVTVVGNSATFYGDAVTGNGAIYAGIPTFTPLASNVVIQFAGNVNSYSQVNFQNVNNGNIASTDYIATADNGDDTSYYVDLGINSSTFNDPADYPGYGANDSYVHNHGGNLILNPESAGKAINFMVGGTDTTDIIATMSNTQLSVSGIVSATGNVTGGNVATAGLVTATGNVTGGNVNTAGQVTATGNITGGNVLTGGLISATGTITSAANISGGNVLTGGQVSATGNITGSAVNTNSIVGSNVTITSTGTLNLAPTGNITANSKNINNLADPTQDQDAATKAYVDSVAQGLDVKASVVYATTTNLPAYTYNNGTSGVGATLTAQAVGNLTLDGTVVSSGQRVLIKNEVGAFVDNTTQSAAFNGIYVVTTAGSPSVAYVLTRTTDFDNGSPSGEIPGAFTFVEFGATEADTGWVCTTNNPVTVGTTQITWAQFSGAGSYTAGAGLSLTGTQFNVLTDGNANPTTAINGSNQVVVPAGAAFITPNIGAATGTSLNATGNVSGGNILTGGLISATGTITSATTITGGNIATGGTVSATGNVTGGNVNTAGQVTATGNITGGNLLTAGLVSATGEITGANITGSNLLTTGIVSATGNVTGGNVTTAGQVTATGNVTGGNVTTAGQVGAGTASITGNISGGNILTGGLVSATGTVTGGNIATTGTVSATGTVTGGNIATGGTVSATGNITGGNILSSGSGSFTGNVTAANFIGNISGNIDAAGANTQVQFNDTGDILGASAGFTFDKSANLLTVTGNIQGGNLLTTGIISSTGTATAGNVDTGGTVSATGNVTGGNVNTAGLVTATGNVTGGNVNTAGLVTATGNVIGGNVTTAGLVTATGNVTGGNITTAGQVTATGNIYGGNLILAGAALDTSAGRLTVNSTSADADFAVNGDTVANVFYIDAGTGTATFGSSTQTVNAIVAFNATNSILFPVGNTVQRPATGVTGMVRFNTTNNNMELYDNSEWTAVGVPSFTVIADEQFAGDDSTVAFTLSSTQTTNSCIVSINGVVQIPTIAYSVSGTDPTCVLTFTEAPAAGDVIDVRQITTTTTITGLNNGNAEVNLNSEDVIITGDLVPSADLTYSLGNSTLRWANLHVGGNTIFLGNLQLKEASANTFAVYTSDGVTEANIAVGNIDVTSIQSGTSSISISAPNGNAVLNVAGTNSVIATSTGAVITGALSATGNITGGNLSVGTGTVTVGNIVNGNGNGVGNIGSSSTYFNTVFAKATSAQYADLAEKYVADAEYAPGTVVVFGGTHEVTVNATDADRKVAGVVSTNPSYIMNGGLEAEHVATVALTGRVPTMVIGPVRKGDMMVAAGLGRARAEADPRVGTVIGKALEDFDGAEGTIEVVVGRF